MNTTNIKIKLNNNEMAIYGLRYHFTPFILTFKEVIGLYSNISSYTEIYDISRAQSKDDLVFRIDEFNHGSLHLSIRETEDQDGKEVLINHNEGEEFFQTFMCVVSAFVQNKKNEERFTSAQAVLA